MKATRERFVPEESSGQIMAEHLSRYYMTEQLVSVDGKVVLDIACGAGYGTELLARKASYAYGIDISPEAVNYAKTKHHRDNLTYWIGDCCAIPMDDASVDIVVSFETIEHIENHPLFLAEIKRVLRPDGILIISSPNKRLYTDILKTNNPFHVHELYTDEFVKLVTEHFCHTAFFGQNHIWGSIIFPISETTFSHGIGDITSGSVQEKETLYNIAIASNAPLHLNNQYATLVYDITDRLGPLLQQQYQAGYERCRKTPSFRLGHALLHPMSWLNGKKNK